MNPTFFDPTPGPVPVAAAAAVVSVAAATVVSVAAAAVVSVAAAAVVSVAAAVVSAAAAVVSAATVVSAALSLEHPTARIESAAKAAGMRSRDRKLSSRRFNTCAYYCVCCCVAVGLCCCGGCVAVGSWALRWWASLRRPSTGLPEDRRFAASRARSAPRGSPDTGPHRAQTG